MRVSHAGLVLLGSLALLACGGATPSNGAPAPITEDVDGDGVVAEDQCPCFAEDRDGFEDEDGCPDLDNDQDGHPDACDECPDAPEVINGTEDGDGCPDEGRREPRSSSIRVAELSFTADTSALSAEHQRSLRELLGRVVHYRHRTASVLATSSLHEEGAEARATSRAEAARAFLIANGLEPDQIDVRTSVGRERLLVLSVDRPLPREPYSSCRPPPLVSFCESPGAERVADRCPNLLEDHDGYEDDDGCPDVDNDGDGVPDRDDACPCEAEDIDTWRDEDGCPDPDNDGDRIADACDACPGEPETWNGRDDTDGCPDERLVQVVSDRIEILDSIFFASNTSEIRRQSIAVVDQLAAVLNAHPEFDRVAIDGHTSRGERRPTQLSQARAEAVRDVLVARGVDADRFELRTLGTTQPLQPGSRDHNRRVSFEILHVASPPPPPPPPAEGDLTCPNGSYAPPRYVCVAERASAVPTHHAPETETASESPPMPDPASALAWWDGDQIMLREEVAFRTDKAEIRSRSFPLIDAIATALHARPTVQVEVAAHTDSDSICPHCGRRLTHDRASSVRAALIHRGELDPNRLTARSYGDSRPRAQCDDLQGRRRGRCLAQNRRVEFHVVPPAPPTTSAIREDVVRFERLSPRVVLHISYREVANYGLVRSNGMLVKSGDEVLLIDTAWDDAQTAQIVSWVREHWDRPISAAVITHAHADKMGGVRALHAASIPTYAHAFTNEDAGARDLSRTQHTLHFENGVASLHGVELAYPGPGHTRDNIVAYVADDETLFGGCLIRPGESEGLGNTADADVARWADSVRFLVARYPDVRVVIPSHGDPSDATLLTHTIALASR